MKGATGFFWEGVKDLSLYNKEFESPLLDRTCEEYEVKSKKWINECTAPEYLKLADLAFQHEENYCVTLLQPESKHRLMTRVEQELISIRKQ